MSAFPIPEAALGNHIAFLGKTGSGKSNAAACTVERLIDKKRRVCIIDPTDRYWGLRLLPDGKTPSGLEPIIFGGNHADLPLAASHGAALAEIAGTTTTPIVLSTRLMTVADRTRFFTAFAETLLQKNQGSLHLVIDEAHLFMPQQGAQGAGMTPAMLHAGNNLVSLGRGIGLNIMLLSQRPAKLHKDSLTQVETLIAFRLMAPQDRNAVRDWIKEWADETTGREVMSSLPSLPTGRAWIWAPELNVLRRDDFPLVSTYDSGKPPSPGSKNVPTLRPIDLSAVQGKLEAVAREAAENDPRRLKGRIAELEKQLAAKPLIDPAALLRAREEGRAEQAVIDQAEIRMLTAAIEGARAALAIEAVPRFDPFPRQNAVSAASPQPQTVRQPIARAPLPDSHDPLPKGERVCLAAAAQHIDGVTREQLTILTGYKRSTRDAYLQRLRERGFVAQQSDRWFSTPEGDAALGADFERLPTGDALRAYWLERLPDGERRVLDAVIGYYPDTATRNEIELATGYKRSTRDAYIQRLKTRRLVVVGNDGVSASDLLFGSQSKAAA